LIEDEHIRVVWFTKSDRKIEDFAVAVEPRPIFGSECTRSISTSSSASVDGE
jgi:hypothetical protein